MPRTLPENVAARRPRVNTMDAYRARYAHERQAKRRGKLYDPIPDPNPQTYGVLVRGAGVAAINGEYVFDTDHYIKDPYLIVLLVNYPQNGTTSWLIHDGTNYYYVADETANPWDAQWRVDTDGTAPVPHMELTAVKL